MEKTVAIHFQREKKLQTEPDPSLIINRISFKTSAKYLGMIFDQILYWKTYDLDQCSSNCVPRHTSVP